MKTKLPRGYTSRSLASMLSAGAAVLASLNATTSRAQTSQLVLDHGAYYPGETISVGFSGGPGNKTDWIGIYPEDIVPGSVGATIWNYVSGTRTASIGLTEGSVTFGSGLSLAGVWDVHFLELDGYHSITKLKLTIIDPTSPQIHAFKTVYAPGEDIRITFTNGPANPKDWVAFYKEGEVPGAVNSTIWLYVNGTQTATAGSSDGTLVFKGGLKNPGQWKAFLLANDGYDVLATEPVTVQATLDSQPRLTAIDPADNATNGLPAQGYSAVIINGTSRVVLTSIGLKLDGTTVPGSLTDQTNQVKVQYLTDTVQPAGSVHTYTLTFADSNGNRQTNEVHFKVQTYTNLHLPTALYFENFDSTDEGKLPAGWSQKSYTEAQNTEVDFGNLDSTAYATWTVVNVDRFKGSFVTYSNPDGSQSEKEDYQRVLASGPNNVVDGKLVRPLATGRMLFADSGYRNGRSQVLFAYSPDYNLTGRTNIASSAEFVGRRGFV